jgi:transcriptional regulator with XRE-family HTH domain
MQQTIRKTAGAYLREWRGKRRMSQLELANEAEISARHLSFLETGRSQASREVLLRLSEQLDIPTAKALGLEVPATMRTGSQSVFRHALQDGPRRHRFEAARLALPLRPVRRTG